mmetsp:Transcript_95261/g.199242  ORF Transcript_95261/g.199242 Transcript_95261/m.199242 type:complete len:305 (+) Transcript_95261:204-1118(+)
MSEVRHTNSRVAACLRINDQDCCEYCGATPGWLGYTGFGLRAKRHAQRCQRRRLSTADSGMDEAAAASNQNENPRQHFSNDHAEPAPEPESSSVGTGATTCLYNDRSDVPVSSVPAYAEVSKIRLPSDPSLGAGGEVTPPPEVSHWPSSPQISGLDLPQVAAEGTEDVVPAPLSMVVEGNNSQVAESSASQIVVVGEQPAALGTALATAVVGEEEAKEEEKVETEEKKDEEEGSKEDSQQKEKDNEKAPDSSDAQKNPKPAEDEGKSIDKSAAEDAAGGEGAVEGNAAAEDGAPAAKEGETKAA